MALPHSIEDEAVATEATDVPTLLNENNSLRDRLLRALAEAENTRRRADRTVEDARKFAIGLRARAFDRGRQSAAHDRCRGWPGAVGGGERGAHRRCSGDATRLLANA